MKYDTLQIGETGIELLFQEDEFLGLGMITIDGVEIRSNTIPLRPLLLSIDGVAFGRFTLEEVTTNKERSTLHITARGMPTGQSLYMDHLGIQTARFELSRTGRPPAGGAVR